MTPKTLKALKGSISKWEKIVAGTGRDLAEENCALCKAFPNSCEGCPVAAATGRHYCSGSPYIEWSRLQNPDVITDRLYLGRKAVSDHAKSVAQKEVDFLKSLLLVLP